EPPTIGGHHPVRPRSRRQDEGGVYGHVREATGGRRRAYPPHGGLCPQRPRRSVDDTAVIAFAGAPRNEKAGGPGPTPGPPAPWRTGQSPEACMPALMESITELSASVDTSPTGRSSATSRSRRRMILPERVFGSSETTRIERGLAIGPISLATWLRSVATTSLPSPLWFAFSAASPRRMTKATTAWP